MSEFRAFPEELRFVRVRKLVTKLQFGNELRPHWHLHDHDRMAKCTYARANACQQAEHPSKSQEHAKHRELLMLIARGSKMRKRKNGVKKLEHTRHDEHPVHQAEQTEGSRKLSSSLLKLILFTFRATETASRNHNKKPAQEGVIHGSDARQKEGFQPE